MSTKAKSVKNQVVSVTWKDASNMPGWVDEDAKMHPLIEVQSVGWLANETKDAIYISSGVDHTRGGWTGMIAIPKGWIKKRRIVKL
jgi:hypothetical protein